MEMRRAFFELFWEEQLEREREGLPLRIPTGTDAEDKWLLAVGSLEIDCMLDRALETEAL